MVGTSIKPTTEGIGGIGLHDPLAPTADNYARVAGLLPLARNTLNSLIVATAGTLVTVLLCSLAGFAFAKYEFPRPGCSLPLPAGNDARAARGGHCSDVPDHEEAGLDQYVLGADRSARRHRHRHFLHAPVHRGFPAEIIEQGRIDGCGELRIYWQLVLPAITPAMAAWATISFIARWNDFMWPLLFMRSKEMYTLMVSISDPPRERGSLDALARHHGGDDYRGAAADRRILRPAALSGFGAHAGSGQGLSVARRRLHKRDS